MSKLRVVIGVCGLNGSGKSTICSFYRDKGYTVLSLSDVIRKVLKERNQEESRKLMIDTGNELRNKHGAGILAKLIINTMDVNSDYVIDSIRHPDEVKELRNGLHSHRFCLVGVNCSQETRYKRLIQRDRQGESNNLTYEQFVKVDNQELNNPDPNGQQISKVLDECDVKIDNDQHDTIDLFRSYIHNTLESRIQSYFTNNNTH